MTQPFLSPRRIVCQRPGVGGVGFPVFPRGADDSQGALLPGRQGNGPLPECAASGVIRQGFQPAQPRRSYDCCRRGGRQPALKTLDWGLALMTLGVISICAFAAVAVLSFWTMRGANWFAFPPLYGMAARIDDFEANYPRAPTSALLDGLQTHAADYFQEAFFRNEHVLNGKRLAQFWTFVALAVEITSVICLVVLIFWGTQTLQCGEVLTQTVRCAPQ